jgi:hypothetical protein
MTDQRSFFGGIEMKIGRVLTLAAIGFAAPISAQAASVLNFSVTADNAFQIYLSTDNSQLGTLVYSNYGLPASQWGTSFQFSANLTAPVEYVQVIGSNYTPGNGLWPDPGTPNGTSPNPDAFLGQLSISSGYVFAANGTTSLLTNSSPGQWYGVDVTDNVNWTTPTNPVQNFGLNGGNNIWGNDLGGPVSGISTSAYWIWSLPDNAAYADLSTEIISSTSDIGGAPLPAAFPLFASGLGAMGLLGWRRKRKNAAIAAA